MTPISSLSMPPLVNRILEHGLTRQKGFPGPRRKDAAGILLQERTDDKNEPLAGSAEAHLKKILNQIDTPYLDSAGNGLAYLIKHFINEENFCYLHLKGGVRSRLAEQGALLL